jgi:Tfp pilus assembly protein PilX
MKGVFVCLLLLLLGTTGCETRKREEELQQKETALNQKEQELALKEKTLQAREDELNQRAQKLDSTSHADTASQVLPALVGTWSAKMTCTETTCTGSAVGDTKTEQWTFSYQGNTILVKANAGEKLVRSYTGIYNGSAVELAEERTTTNSEPAAKMVVRLRLLDDANMEGQREIVRDDCRVVYSVQLQKQ